MTCYKLFC